MANGNVCQVEQRRLVCRARVHYLEYGLEVAIQIDNRQRPALEGQRLISRIPPSMRYPAREPYGLAGPRVNSLATNLRGQDAGRDQPLLVLEVMHVPRGTLSMRGQRASDFEDRLAILFLSLKLEDLAGVPVLQSQVRHEG
jgi:hypothetical protein